MARRIGWIERVAVCCTILLLCVPSVAMAGSPIPGYAHRVGGTKTGTGSSWSIWLFGRHNNQCWATKTIEGGSSSEEALCGFSVPAHPWQLAAKGTFGSGRARESVLFFLTRESVVRLNVEVERSRNRQVWMHLATRHLSFRAANNARIDPNFSYALGISSGSSLCVKRVVAVTRSGKKISRGQESSCSARMGHE